MLAFVTTVFFTLALIGAIGVIAVMFAGYRDKIQSVILTELAPARCSTADRSVRCHLRTVKSQQPMKHHRSPQTAPLRAAA